MPKKCLARAHKNPTKSSRRNDFMRLVFYVAIHIYIYAWHYDISWFGNKLYSNVNVSDIGVVYEHAYDDTWFKD